MKTKRLLLVSLLLGIFTAISLYLLTIPWPKPASMTELCNGMYLLVPGKIQAGAPLSSHITIHYVPCGSTYEQPPISLKETPKFLLTWQFWANSAIWTMAWVGVLFLIMRFYANSRH